MAAKKTTVNKEDPTLPAKEYRAARDAYREFCRFSKNVMDSGEFTAAGGYLPLKVSFGNAKPVTLYLDEADIINFKALADAAVDNMREQAIEDIIEQDEKGE